MSMLTLDWQQGHFLVMELAGMSSQRYRQDQQNKWPQFVTTGFLGESKQTAHLNMFWLAGAGAELSVFVSVPSLFLILSLSFLRFRLDFDLELEVSDTEVEVEVRNDESKSHPFVRSIRSV